MNITVEVLDQAETEVSGKFLRYMARRMMTSMFKYGKVADAYPAKVNALRSLHQRLDRYERDGNTEWLVDVANFAMIEFMHPNHPLAHFEPTDSAESPGRSWNTGAVTPQANTHQVEQGRTGGLYKRKGD